MLRDDLLWLAGLLEGEGSFQAGPPSKRNQPRITIEMCDLDVIERVARLFSVAYVNPTKRDPKWKPTFRVMLCGSRAVALMHDLRPLMGHRRRGQIDTALESYRPTSPGDNKRKLTRPQVEDARRRRAKGETLLQLAAEYGVSRNTLRKACDGRTWKTV